MALIKRTFPSFPNLSDFFGDDWFTTKFSNENWSPAINVIDNENNYEIEVAAPGLKKENFEVHVENGILTISGKTEKENEEKNKNYTRKEFSSRSFSNSFTLPENADADNIGAKYDNGVLHLTINKKQKETPAKKQVSVQ
ncbi:MAG: Hsp20/alpha crystallin family protein [Bacteroidia bacterium]